MLDRGDGTVQVGLRTPVVFSGLSSEQRLFVERLEGANQVSDTSRSRFADLVARLEDAGLFAPPPAARRVVALNDGGPVGLSIGIALARAGWSVRFEDAGPASASPPHSYAPGTLAATRQAAASDAVARLIPEADARVGADRADVWVLVSHGAPTIDTALALMASDTPHLFVVTDEAGATVGPFAVPGLGACGICDGLARTAADPAWPRLSLQLRSPSVVPPMAPADVVASISGLACGALESWRGGELRPWLDREWILTAHNPPRSVPVAPDAGCGCGAAFPVGDELAARRSRFP